MNRSSKQSATPHSFSIIWRIPGQALLSRAVRQSRRSSRINRTRAPSSWSPCQNSRCRRSSSSGARSSRLPTHRHTSSAWAWPSAALRPISPAKTNLSNSPSDKPSRDSQAARMLRSSVRRMTPPRSQMTASIAALGSMLQRLDVQHQRIALPVEIRDGGGPLKTEPLIKLPRPVVGRASGGIGDQHPAALLAHFLLDLLHQRTADTLPLEFRPDRHPVEIIRPVGQWGGAVAGEARHLSADLGGEEEVAIMIRASQVISEQLGNAGGLFRSE